MVQQGRHHACDRSAAGLYDHASAWFLPDRVRLRGVFLPQIMPQDFVSNTATPLLLRPREFLANARDLVTLKAAVAEQAPRYANIGAPMVVITGDVDKTVSTNIHSRPLAAVVRMQS